ncbi:hypothetical protein [Emticicia sp. 17c]|uniref:hypothetical protein n=1 Tax=Emticicia sp. 17c TaxID=3127704 RepID=UPI00301E48DE
MKKMNQPLSVLRKGFFLVLVLAGFALSSCETESVTPQQQPNTFADDDPPKDTGPIRPPGGGGGSSGG